MDFSTSREQGNGICHCRLSFDGASKGNPGPAGCGFDLICHNPDLHQQGSIRLGITTNNVAEYCGLIEGLKMLIEIWKSRLDSKPCVITITGDSQLVIRQMKGIYQVRDAKLISLHQMVQQLVGQLIAGGCQIEWQHVKRQWNSVADRLSNQKI